MTTRAVPLHVESDDVTFTFSYVAPFNRWSGCPPSCDCAADSNLKGCGAYATAAVRRAPSSVSDRFVA